MRVLLILFVVVMCGLSYAHSNGGHYGGKPRPKKLQGRRGKPRMKKPQPRMKKPQPRMKTPQGPPTKKFARRHKKRRSNQSHNRPRNQHQNQYQKQYQNQYQKQHASYDDKASDNDYGKISSYDDNFSGNGYGKVYWDPDVYTVMKEIAGPHFGGKTGSGLKFPEIDDPNCAAGSYHAMVCEKSYTGKTYVKPGDKYGSYIYDRLYKEEMPPGGLKNKDHLKLIEAWIDGGCDYDEKGTIAVPTCSD